MRKGITALLHKGPDLENIIAKTEREKAQHPAEFEPMTTCLRILRLSIGCITAVRVIYQETVGSNASGG